MLDTVAAAAEEMTGTTGITAGSTDILCNVLQINAVFWMPGLARRFAIRPGSVMTHHAVDVFFRGEIIALVFPAEAYMASRAVGKIGLRRNAEVIQYVALAQALFVIGIKKFPGPVLGFMKLLGSLGMACDTGPGDFRAGFEILLQLLELGMISCRYGRCCASKNSEDKNAPQ